MAQNEIQTLTLYGSPTGGTFSLEFDGQVASGIAYNAIAATVQSALEAVSTIGSGNVSCSGGPFPGSAITCEFQGSLASKNVSELILDPTGLTGVSLTGSISETTAGSSNLLTNLNAYWKCDGSGSSLQDSHSTVNLSGRSTPYPTFDTGIIANSRKFRFGDSGFESGSTTSTSSAIWKICNAPAGFSFSFWIKTEGASPIFRIVDAFANNIYSYTTPWTVTHDGSGKIIFGVFGTSSAHYTYSSILSSGTWHHICLTYDPTAMESRIYLNGTLDSQTTGVSPHTSLSTPGHFYVGRNFSSSHARWLDEMAHWSSVLTSSDVQSLYNSGSGLAYGSLATGQNEIQTLSLSGSPAQGSVFVSYGGSGVSIPYNSTASAVESLLESTSFISTGDVSCSGGPLPGSAVAIQFTGNLAQTDVDTLAISYYDLWYSVETTQTGAPTPSQASFTLSSGTLTPHISGASATFSSGNATASGIPEQATLASSSASLQAPGIINSSLPTATLSSGTVLSANPQQATLTLTSGTAVPYGVVGTPAKMKFKLVPFAADLDPVPAQIVASAGTITPFSGILSPATLVASSANAIPVVEATGPATMSLTTTEVTLELFGVPVSIELSAAEVLSPVLEQATLTLISSNVYEKQIAAPGFMGLSTFRIIDQDLILVTINNKQVAVPELTSQSLTIPELTGESLLTPGLVSESLL